MGDCARACAPLLYEIGFGMVVCCFALAGAGVCAGVTWCETERCGGWRALACKGFFTQKEVH